MSETPAEQPQALPLSPKSLTPRWQRHFETLAVVAMLPSVIAGTAHWWWVGDLCAHFRMPYAIGLSLLLLVFLWLRFWRWTMAVGVVLAVNLLLLWPLYVAPSVTSATTASVDADKQTLRVMSANVFIGNRHPQPILEQVRREQPDVLLLLEVDQRWLSDLSELEADYPYRVVAIRDEGFAGYGPFGIALLSRRPFIETQTPRLGSARTPAAVAKIAHAGGVWNIVGVHPYPPISGECSTARNTLLKDLAVLCRQTSGPTVVLGDLNNTRWSPYFVDLLRDGGLRDSSEGFGYQPTWPDTSVGAIIPIDHVLVSPEVAVVQRRVGGSIDSDHLPVIADLAPADRE